MPSRMQVRAKNCSSVQEAIAVAGAAEIQAFCADVRAGVVANLTPNPSIERTFQRPLRALWAAAHVELQGLPRFVKRH
jgi:hypothetical protein